MAKTFLPISSGGGTGLTNPMNTAGQMIWGASAGTATALGVGSVGQMLQTTGASNPIWSSPLTAYNFLVNGAFDYWQAGTSLSLTSTGGATPNNISGYCADQWYANNALGGATAAGIIQFTQVASAIVGSVWSAQVKITTGASGTGSQNGCELWQVLSKTASQQLIGQTASFSCQVKALGSVNQVGMQFYYAGNESKPFTLSLGSEITSGVTTSVSSLCQLNGQQMAIGASIGTTGVFAVRIRPTAVGSSQLYTAGQGIIVDQACLNLGSVAIPFQRQYADPVQELAACNYFYAKTFPLTTAPASNTGDLTGLVSDISSSTGQYHGGTWRFPVPMRITPAITPFNPGSTTVAWRNNANTADYAIGLTASLGTNGYFITTSNVIVNDTFAIIHLTADARI